MNQQKSIVRKVLSVLEYYGVSFEHMPSSIDAVNFLIPKSSINDAIRSAVLSEIKKSIRPDEIKFIDRLSIVSVVGRNMYQCVGVAEKMFAELAREKINIRMIIQVSTLLQESTKTAMKTQYARCIALFWRKKLLLNTILMRS